LINKKNLVCRQICRRNVGAREKRKLVLFQTGNQGGKRGEGVGFTDNEGGGGGDVQTTAKRTYKE